MDNQTKPESSGSMMISTSELRKRAVPKNVLVKYLLSRTPNVPPNEIALEAQNRSAVKVEPSDKIVLQKRTPRHNSKHEAPHVPLDEIDLGAQNQSEVKVEPRQYKYRAERDDGRGGGGGWGGGTGGGGGGGGTRSGGNKIDLKDEIDLEAQNQSEVKVELPEKIALQVQNQSELKVEPKPRRYTSSAVGFYNSQSWPPRQILNHEVVLEPQNRSEVKVEPPEKIALQVQNRSKVKIESKLLLSAQDQINEETTEWALLITSVLLEAMSAVFDQVGHALTGMVIAFLALFLSSLDLICKARKEGGNWSQPFGGLLEYFGLAAAVWQCFYSTMEYLYTRKNQQNPIKIYWTVKCAMPAVGGDSDASKLGSKQIFIVKLLYADVLKPIILCKSLHDSLDFSLDLYFLSETAGKRPEKYCFTPLPSTNSRLLDRTQGASNRKKFGNGAVAKKFTAIIS
ncbi:hypothetical protein NC651_017358 [Populus alba x Populus x berolinensis]|nr:hypothetical protein NC651_017358 [Populus alba x Populus x berolinensis]